MSCTEIYGFDKDGNAFFLGEVQNAFRGAMAVWTEFEKKYLPPNDPYGTGHMTRMMCFLGEDKAQEVWDLVRDDRLSEDEKIVMASTFDRVIVRKENFDKLIKAFRSFWGDTSLKEQADIIEKAGDDCIAIAWNQTSVNGTPWQKYNNDTEEYEPYNLNDDDAYWFLFQEEE